MERIGDLLGRSRKEAMDVALRRWSDGHENGESYLVGEIGDDVNELDEDVGGELLLAAESALEIAVYLLEDGREVAVADANGPRAVDISPAR